MDDYEEKQCGTDCCVCSGSWRSCCCGSYRLFHEKPKRDAYGENYLPNMRLTDEEIEVRYGIANDLYSSAIAEVPMISAQVDELVLIKANDEAARDTIEEALTAYQNVLREDTFQYPANLLKIQASQVYVRGDYVCFIMLGVLDNETAQQADEGKVIEAYKTENEKAVAAIDALF